MPERRLVLLLAAVLIAACGGGTPRHAKPAGRTAAAAAPVRRDTTPPVVDTTPRDTVPPEREPAPIGRPARVHHLNTPNPVRGLYVNRRVANSDAVWTLIDLARHSRVNALVFDVKDDEGRLLYPSTVGLAHVIGADTANAMPVRRLHALMDTLRKYRIYAVARIVVARDPVLAAHRPQWAVRRRPDDPERNNWLDPRQRAVWAYAADLASEAAARGFSEVQFADVRFPASKDLSERLELASPDGRTRGEVLRAQLGFLESRMAVLNVPMAISVDGMAAVDSSDLGVGLRWEAFADHADVVLPTVFPSRVPAGTFGLADPAADPYGVARRMVGDARRRSAPLRDAARLVPWYQDFSTGVRHYGPEQVWEQIRAGESHGIRSWMLWNPSSSYTASTLRPPRDTTAAARPSGRAGGRSRR